MAELFVAPIGIEPISEEPESSILSIELRSRGAKLSNCRLSQKSISKPRQVRGIRST